MIEVQYFYTGTEALLVKIVFTENRLFKEKFLENIGGANAPPAPPAPPPMLQIASCELVFTRMDNMKAEGRQFVK